MGIGLVRLEVGGNNTLLSVLFFCLACVLSISPLYAQPEISAPMTDSLSADANNDGQADPGDTLEYTTTITNTGDQNADSVLFSLTPDPNTTLVSGSVQISPLADDQTVTTNADTDLAITLTGSDGDGEPLTFSLVSPPANGSLGPLTPLSPTSAQVTYTPPTGFTGTDSFTFTVNDGTADANEVGTVSITVQPTGTPIADSQMVTTNEDPTVPITLTGQILIMSPSPSPWSGTPRTASSVGPLLT